MSNVIRFPFTKLACRCAECVETIVSMQATVRLENEIIDDIMKTLPNEEEKKRALIDELLRL